MAHQVTNLRVRRVAQGLRLLDLSRRTGVPQSRLSLIERLEVQPSAREDADLD